MTDQEQDLLEIKMKSLIASKEAVIITDELIGKLIGKRIQTLYFGYKGQNGVDDFIVSGVKSVMYPSGYVENPSIFTVEGRDTFIRTLPENGGSFTCSDSDRFVYFIVV